MGGRAAAGLGLAVAAFALPAFPGTALGAVRIGDDAIVVEGEGARAVIERAPFRLRIEDGEGRRVLSEVENRGQGPVLVPPLPEPQPGGFENYDTPALYAPMTFTVGAGRPLQPHSTQWGSNVLAGVEAGIQYSARDVVGARRTGEGVSLLVSTSDPSGRQLVVTVAPAGSRTMRVTARPTPSDGVATMGDSFSSGAGEAFRGFGGRHNALDQRGEDFYNWLEQENFSAGALDPLVAEIPGSGGNRYLFPNGPTAAYYVQSLFVSSRPYGFLLDRPELSRWRMASDRPDAWQVGVAGTELDYLVTPGDSPEAIARLSELNGRHELPPEWGLGPIFDRAQRFPSESAADQRRRVLDDLANIERYDLPITAYRVEAWELFERSDLREIIERLRARGIRTMLYFRAFVGTDDVGTDIPANYDEALSKGYVARTATGQPYVFLSNFNAPAALIDFTNPAALAWWEERITEALDLGADGFMQDFGEQVMLDMRFANGETGATMHNRYPILFHRATRDAIDAYQREHPDREIFFYTRAGYSGTPGSAAYETSTFPGDETTDWTRSAGLASLATDMLNRAVGGAFGFNTDIGGYFDIGPYEPTTKELLIRWAEWAALTPVYRLHGSQSAGTHTPWSYDDETVEIYKEISRLHIRARPLILRLWREGVRTGMPPTRPLWLAYPGDQEAAKQDQQWLLGPDVLVAPVVEEGAVRRRVYFPEGCWRSPVSGAQVEGPGYETVDAPLAALPYFFRCGTDPFAQAARAARPRLRLALRCVHGDLRAAVVGRDRRRVRRAAFYVGRRAAGRDRRAPFARTVDARAFRGARRWRVRALARLRGGQLVRLGRSVRPCSR